MVGWWDDGMVGVSVPKNGGILGLEFRGNSWVAIFSGMIPIRP